MRLVRLQGGTLILILKQRNRDNVELQMNQALVGLVPPPQKCPILAEDQRVICSLQG